MKAAQERQTHIRVLLTVSALSTTAAQYRHLLAFIKYIPRDRFQLTVCSFRNQGYEEMKAYLDERCIPVFVARVRPRGNKLRHFRDFWEDQSLIEQHGPFDIQHSLDFSATPLEAIAAKLKSRYFICSQRNVMPDHEWVYRTKFFFCDRIIAISDVVHNRLLELKVPSQKIRKIYNGIDVPQITNQLRTSQPKKSGTILFVGHIVRLKRHEDAIQAVAALINDLPYITLQIAGAVYDKDYYKELCQLVENLNLEAHINFLGSREDIIPLMQEAELLVLCSQHEAIPLTILEAMAVGLPVVASNIPGNRQLIQNGREGLLVPIGDIQSYIQAIRTLLTQPQQARKLAHQARLTMEQNFTAARMVSQTVDTYKELMGI